MKTSELIEQLRALLSEHGDVYVVCLGPDGYEMCPDTVIFQSQRSQGAANPLLEPCAMLVQRKHD